MVYVSGGNVVESQSPWRLSIIPETFWAIINFIVLLSANRWRHHSQKSDSDSNPPLTDFSRITSYRDKPKTSERSRVMYEEKGFKTLIQPDLTKHGNSHTTDYRSGGDGRPPQPPRRRMGGFRGGRGAPEAPPMGGGG